MAQNYDVVVVGAGAAGVFMAYEFVKLDKNIKVCIIDQGGPVSKRKCPIDGKKVKSCIHCKVCSIMHGFGGAGGMSDGKYNITNNFGGDLYTFTGKEKAIELMQYVDKITLKWAVRTLSFTPQLLPTLRQWLLNMTSTSLTLR